MSSDYTDYSLLTLLLSYVFFLKAAANHVKAWETLGYTYNELKIKTEKHDEAVKDKRVKMVAINEELWKQLSKIKSKLDFKMSASFLVDKSINHFR